MKNTKKDDSTKATNTETEVMYSYRYPHPAVTTDCVVFGFDGHELKVLLIERGLEPYKGMWALPGGFMRMDETTDECAVRELREETGLDISVMRQLGAFSGVRRDPRERVVTIAYYAMVRHSDVRGGDDAANARWFTLDNVPQLAFDHDYILRQALQRVRRDIHFEPIGFGLLDERFTMTQLQRLYEAVLGINFDRRNFHKKMLQTGILTLVEDPNNPKLTTQYYGSHRQMKSRDISELFGEPGTQKKGRKHSAPQPEKLEESEYSDIAEMMKNTEILTDADLLPAHSHGRPARKYSFNEEGYKRMKESGNWQLEF